MDIIVGFLMYVGIMVAAYGFAWSMNYVLPRTKEWGYDG